MSEAEAVTIVIPNWNTGQLLRLCLASLVRHTQHPHEIVVVDNDSDDASRATAEGAAEAGLIRLIRRPEAKHDGAPEHAASLDAGVAGASTPLALTLDSDAWARRDGWLGSFVAALGDQSHAGARKFPGGRVKRFFQWARREQPRPEACYIRPCHALYRVALLRELGLSFAPSQDAEGRWRTTGETIHQELVAHGHPGVFLSHSEIQGLVGHLRHATMVINFERFPGLRARARRRGEERIQRVLQSREAVRILTGSPVP